MAAAGGSDIVAERLPRPFALAVTSALFCGLCLLAAYGGKDFLHIVAGGAGISIGAINGLEPVRSVRARPGIPMVLGRIDVRS